MSEKVEILMNTSFSGPVPLVPKGTRLYRNKDATEKKAD